MEPGEKDDHDSDYKKIITTLFKKWALEGCHKKKLIKFTYLVNCMMKEDNLEL